MLRFPPNVDLGYVCVCFVGEKIPSWKSVLHLVQDPSAQGRVTFVSTEVHTEMFGSRLTALARTAAKQDEQAAQKTTETAQNTANATDATATATNTGIDLTATVPEDNATLDGLVHPASTAAVHHSVGGSGNDAVGSVQLSQLMQMLTDEKKERAEMESKARKERAEMEAKARKERAEMEAKARKERAEMEAKSRQERAEMETKMNALLRVVTQLAPNVAPAASDIASSKSCGLWTPDWKKIVRKRTARGLTFRLHVASAIPKITPNLSTLNPHVIDVHCLKKWRPPLARAEGCLDSRPAYERVHVRVWRVFGFRSLLSMRVLQHGCWKNVPLQKPRGKGSARDPTSAMSCW